MVATLSFKSARMFLCKFRKKETSRANAARKRDELTGKKFDVSARRLEAFFAGKGFGTYPQLSDLMETDCDD